MSSSRSKMCIVTACFASVAFATTPTASGSNSNTSGRGLERSFVAADWHVDRSQYLRHGERLKATFTVQGRNGPLRARTIPAQFSGGFVAATFIGPPQGAKRPSGLREDVDQVMGYLTRKQYDLALELALKITLAHPNDPVGYHLRGGAYVAKQDLANARKNFDKALSLQPSNIEVLTNLAQLDVLEKDAVSARKRYQTILGKNPKFVPAILGMAQLESGSGNERQSIAWLEKAKTADPKLRRPRLTIAAYYLRTKDYANALAELTEAQRLNPADPEILSMLGQAQLAYGQKWQAVLTYKKLASASPTSPEASYRLAMAQVNDGDYAGATENLNKVVELKPDYEEAIAALASLEVRAGRPAEALKLARDLQRVTSKAPAGLSIEGDVLAAQGQYVAAANAYEQGLAIRPTGLMAAKLHMASTKAGNATAADAKLQQWLKDHPEDIGAREYMALAYLKAGKRLEAIEQYQLLLTKDPKNVVTLNNLANLYSREKDPRALETAEQAYKVLPDSPMVADTLGWILIDHGSIKRGLELLRMATAKDPESPEIKYHLAAALAKSGEKRQARKLLEPLLAGEEKFPEREAAQLLLKQLGPLPVRAK